MIFDSPLPAPRELESHGWVNFYGECAKHATDEQGSIHGLFIFLCLT